MLQLLGIVLLFIILAYISYLITFNVQNYTDLVNSWKGGAVVAFTLLLCIFVSGTVINIISG